MVSSKNLSWTAASGAVTMRVLITDGNERSALAVTRSLGKQGVQVIVGSEQSHSLASSSKYCFRAFQYPSPHTDPDGFLRRICEEVKSGSIATLFPLSDITMQIIAQHKEELEQHTTIPLPSYERVEAVTDKYRLMELASTVQVPIPETVFVPAGRINEMIEQVSNFPVVVKPARSILRQGNCWIKTSVHYAANTRELYHLYQEIPYLRGPSLIQQRIEGEGRGLFALMNQGEPVAMFAHRRLREKPPSGGVSVLRESIELPKSMTDYALRILRHAQWHGVAMVEFKVDRELDVPLLMEVNGRFWGSLQLAIDAGVDFPYLLCQLAIGEPVTASREGYRIGVKSRWLLGDIDHLFLRLFKPANRLNLPPGAAAKWRCVIDFFRLFERNLYYEVERFNDIGPALYEWQDYFRKLIRGNS